MTAALQSLPDKLGQSYEEDDRPMEVCIEDRLVDGDTSNYRQLAGAFPHIFPFCHPRSFGSYSKESGADMVFVLRQALCT